MIFAGALFGGCTDVLDRAPDGLLQMDEILSDPLRVEALLNACYNQIPRKGYVYWFFDPLVVACSDDGWSSDDAADQSVTGCYNDNNTAAKHWLRDWPADNHTPATYNAAYWERSWQQIHLCSQFIELIDQETTAVSEPANRGRFKAEAKVLRAFFYMELVKWFGRVPVIEGSVSYDADFTTYRRDSVAKVARFIVKECTEALAEPMLPWRIDNSADAMRTTKALACALKANAMLFAASPLHNDGLNLWEEAYQEISNSVQLLKANGYELFTACTNQAGFGTGPAAALRQLVCNNADYSATPRDKETIFQVRDGGTFVWHIGYIGCDHPNTYKCGTCPTQELVDAFETIDGKPVLDLAKPYLDERHLQPNYNRDNTLYDPNNPYENRDPRFAEYVLYNGVHIEMEPKAPFTSWDIEIQTYMGGAHEPSWDINNRTHSRTGYYHYKMVTPKSSNAIQINNSNWKYYRLGGLLLDLAEAAAEAGHFAEAAAAANEVRARSGMPDLPAGLSKEDLILRIRNERRIELAWEENRYFDLRRWQTPDGDLSATCKYFTAMQIEKNGSNYTYTRRSIRENPRGGWQNKDLLLPLPFDEASNLEAVTQTKWQNPGW
jgi:hypothetical protein